MRGEHAERRGSTDEDSEVASPWQKKRWVRKVEDTVWNLWMCIEQSDRRKENTEGEEESLPLGLDPSISSWSCQAASGRSYQGGKCASPAYVV